MSASVWCRRVLLAALCVPLWACEPSGRLSGQTMGTTYEVTWARGWWFGRLDAETVRAAVEAELGAVEASMSTYREDSEITAFNRAPQGQWVAVSDAFMDVFEVARAVGEASGGAYDVSVGPLVDLWGFGPGGRAGDVAGGADGIPPPAAIAAARARVGQSAIQVDRNRGALLKGAPRELDFSSVAKGHGVDRVALWLEGQGVESYMVEVGGEIRVAGFSPRGARWRIAVERPEPLGTAPLGALPLAVLELTDTAVATSGDYRNFFEVDGRRYSHSIDPRTGWPVAHELVSVTVVHESAALADAWATALVVLGQPEALRVAIDNGLAAYLVSAGKDEWRVQKTPAMEVWLR